MMIWRKTKSVLATALLFGAFLSMPAQAMSPQAAQQVESATIAVEGSLQYTNLEGGFYTVDGWGLIGDEALFETLQGKRVIARGHAFTGNSYRMVKQVVVSSVLLPLPADRSLPAEVTVNGKRLAGDQSPLLVSGILMLPLRQVVEAAGGQVQWDPQKDSVTVSMPDRMAYFWLGQNEAEMNENHVRYIKRNMIAMEKAPVIINGRTMISADALTEVLGLYEVAGLDESLDLAPLK